MSIQITNDSSIIVYDNAVVGPQGNQGPQGSQGSQGHQGFQGSDTANNRVLKAGDTMTGNLNFSNTFVIAANVNFLGGEPAALLTTNTASGSSNLPLIMHATGANASVLSFWLSHPTNLANSYVGGISVNPQHTSNGLVRILTGQYTGPTYKWDFQSDGKIGFPLLYSDRGDISSGTVYGNTLKFANSTYQAIIAGPEGTDTNPSAERMVIEGGKGYTGTGGEGGDIYLWAGRGGDAGGTGGDIKIRGGYGYSEGGYIKIDGGDTAAGNGGYVEITGGNSSANNGGEVRIIGGIGATGNGNVRITSASNNWYFTANGNLKMPGPINFQQNATIPLGKPAVNGANDRITLWDFEGGGTGYNYAIGAEGNHMWFTMDVNNGTGGFKFYSRDNQVFKIRDDGALIFSDNTVQTTAYTGGGGGGGANTANVTFQDNIVIGTGVGQNDGLYLAAGSGQVANLQYLRLRGGEDDAHIHFDTANVEAYDLYIGDDNKYVKLERGYSGNIIIGSSSNYGKVWKFDTDGALTFPDSSKQNTAYDLITATTQTGSAVLQDVGGTINTITSGSLSLRVVSDSGTAANLQYSINDTVTVKGRTKITTSSSITPSAVSPDGVNTANVWYSLGTVSTVGDLIESVITDHSYHNVYRITFVARQLTSGPNTATGYAAIERLQRG